MSITYWKSLGSLTINQSPMILKAFDGRFFHLYRCLNDSPIEFEGKIVTIYAEFVDAQLDYLVGDGIMPWL